MVKKYLIFFMSIYLVINTKAMDEPTAEKDLVANILTNFEDNLVDNSLMVDDLQESSGNEEPDLVDVSPESTEDEEVEFFELLPEGSKEINLSQTTIIPKDVIESSLNQSIVTNTDIAEPVASKTKKRKRANEDNEESCVPNRQESSGKFPCSLCEKSYKHEVSLNRHCRDKHGNKRPKKNVQPTIIQPISNQTDVDLDLSIRFATDDEVALATNQSATDENTEKKATVKKRKKTKADEDYLPKESKRQGRSRNRTKRCKCSECNTSYAHESSLYRHYKGIHGEGFDCTICNKHIGTYSQLLMHNRKFHGAH